MYWAWKEGSEGRDYRETRNKAANAGTLAHALIDQDVKGTTTVDLSQYDSEIVRLAQGGYRMYQRWAEMSRLNIIDSELSLVDSEYRFGGTIDAVGEIDGEIALLDWKTGNGMYVDHLIQIAAYGHLLKKQGFSLDGGYHCLRFGKEDGSFHHHHYQDLEEFWRAFVLARQLHDMKGPLSKRAR